MCDVLVMGAGPAGLFAASELARRGVPVRIVERELEPHRQVRASSIQARTIEILEAIGIHEAVLERGERMVATVGYDESLNEIYRKPFHYANTSYQHITVLPQWTTEELLVEECARHGVTVERGITATVIEVDITHAVVTLEHGDGTIEHVRPTYLLDAKGAHSQGRKAMHESLEGGTYRGTFAVADCVLETTLPRDSLSQITGSGTVFLFIPLPDDRWLVTVELEDGETELLDEHLADLVFERSGRSTRVLETGWRSVFHAHHRMAGHLGDGRHFLLGDAGHLSSPCGGEGLNAALHDSFDIAWKLDLVMRGRAYPSLLDTYMVERSIADEHVVQVSDLAHNASMAVARDPSSAGAPTDEVVVAAAVNARFMLDVDYSPSPLVLADETDALPRAGHRLRDWNLLGTTDHVLLVFGDVHSGQSLDDFAHRWGGLVEVRHEHPIAAEVAGMPGPGLLLVRPDGHVAARRLGTTEADFSALDSHLQQFLIPAPTQTA